MGEKIERRVQVVVSWGGSPEAVLQVHSGSSLIVGDDPRAGFVLPPELVPSPITLLEGDPSGGFVLRVPTGARAVIERDGQDVSTSARREVDGSSVIELEPNMRASVELGDFSFFFSEGDTEKLPLARPSMRAWRWVGVSLGVHALFLGMLLFMPPNAGALSLDLSHQDRDYIRVHLDAIEREQVEPEAPTPSESAGAQSGQPSPGDQGATGAVEETRHTGGGARARGRSQDQRMPLTAASIQSIGALGALQALGTFSNVSSPYGAADAQGFAEDDAYGNLMADAAGFSTGFDGLAMNGTGRGGGCLPGRPCGEGTIGTGNLGTGFGSCMASEFERIARTEGRPAAMAQCQAGVRGGGPAEGVINGGGHRDRVPVLRPGEADTTGGLSREQIRLVVTRNRAQIRSCYERALINRPDLGGRITVRWMVHQEGRVLLPQITSSELRDNGVEQCMTQAIGRWQFPSSPSPTAVSYPFVFQTQ